MSAFTDKLEYMHNQDIQALFEFAGRLFPGRIAVVAEDYVLVEIEHNEKTVLLHKHINAVGFITGSGLVG
ncbi:hypothetical protein PUN49_26640 [Pseudomonas extremaustralis]|mgnify:FL=1|jgi:hypothetical protein|uniref:Uncharacterized protein n=1 Tax=Pseudomonas extremaustralis TaxID=359110 RepID=A0A5C5Q246_9PSED|nr:hypothetical protein [Pseudomonas extremaustralis]DAO43007.1 MAG TPA: putative small protein [Caudoviricetes sp.]EZI24011.1 hypothetical protein PE143B_0129020 [Pseudomonas extremaustralis 14-3 substr. 14-3b]MDB1113251.1 hypothetical protein [Pseudomonas extremaustralis]MDF3135306.1 hypothetical protein [Pseudomonas extremaustralis]MDG2970580.1 hypothetical protein [Pseudomonas extremaustralis]